MNLFLALFWLICAVLLLIYEHNVGPARYRTPPIMGHDFSWAWLMLTLVLFNLHRWREMRSYRAKQRAAEIARALEEQERRRHATAKATTPDPNFNFTDEPPSPSHRDITDEPPSKN